MQNNDFTGFVEYPFKLTENIDFLIKKRIIKKSDNFLDLGSGLGTQVITSAKLGLNSYGIELNNRVYNKSMNKINELRKNNLLPKNSICNIALGSYYPKEYIDFRKNNKSIAIPYESGIFIPLTNLGMNRIFTKKEIDNWFFPTFTDPSPYDKLKIKLNEIDVLFSYTWGPEIASQLEMFSIFCKKGCIFLLDSYTRHEKLDELIKKLNLKKSIVDVSGRERLMCFEKL